MPLQLTPESFLAVVKQSGLVDAERLQKLLNEFRLRGLKLENARTIADELVASNAITRWQAEKLLQGKHRGFFLGKYRLLSLLGKGGMSSVYLAEHTVMRRRCAIKVLPTKRVNDTSYLGRFHREAQAVANLDHPNIVRAYDVDKEIEGNAEIHFLVMEYVDGESLQEMVAARGVLDFVVAAEYARQSAEGLVHAHEVGMVHRDIKPGNLLVDPNGTLKILDMGLARFFDDDDAESLTVTHDEKVLGTADYLAPEQALDSHTVDARADIYSLGCTLYFMLTGHPPFTEGTLAQRLMSHQMKEPPAITVDRPNCPPDLLAIANKMMAKDVNQRFQSSAEVSAALYGWLAIHADETWRRKHKPDTGSGPMRGGDATRDASSAADRGGLQFVPQGGLFTATAPTPATTDNTANLSTSETETGPHDFREVRGPAKPLIAGDDIPLAPIDEDDSKGDSPLPAKSNKAEPQKRPAPAGTPARAAEQRTQPQKPLRDSTPGKSPVAQTKQPGTAPTAPGNGPTAPQRSANPAKGISSAGTRPSVASKTGDGPPQPAGTSPSRPAQRPNLSRPIIGDDQVEDPVAEALPIESETPLAETATPPPRWSADSRVLRSGSSVLRGKNRPNDKAVVAGAGLVLLLVVVVVVLVVVNLNKSPDSTAVNAGNAADADITVGPTGKFGSITEALNHVRQTFVPESATATRTIRVVGGRVYTEGIQIDGGPSGLKWPAGIRLICDDGPERAILAPTVSGPVISLADVQQFTIEGFELQANGRAATAVELKGNLAGTRLSKLNINGFTAKGINSQGARGADQGQMVLSGLNLKGNSPQSVGLQLNRVQYASVRECRFLGPMSAGILIDGAEPQLTRLEIEDSIFAGAEVGIKIDAIKSQFNRLKVVRNTFHNLQYGIEFTGLPVSAPNVRPDLKLQSNLFSQIRGAEAYLASGSVDSILKMADENGIESNYSERTPTREATLTKSTCSRTRASAA
nr:putative signal transduction protein [uncultured bacterium]